MDTNAIVDILSALPTSKLISTVSAGIGKVYEPRYKRKMADATAYEINAIAEAMRNAADLPIVYNQDGVAINSEDFQRLMQRAGTRLVLQETIKQHNIESVVDNAYEILEQEESCSEEPVEQGWINRFFNCVEDIGDADLHVIFGKILAGEIKQPRSFSKRTLDTIRNLSQYEAKIFQKVTPFIVHFGKDAFIPSEGKILEKYDVQYGDLMLLRECGLVCTADHAGLTYELNQGDECAIHNRFEMIKAKRNSKGTTRFSIGAYALTTAGRELYTVMEPDPCHAYLYDLAKSIYQHNRGLQVTIHRINHIYEREIDYQETATEIINEAAK